MGIFLYSIFRVYELIKMSKYEAMQEKSVAEFSNLDVEVDRARELTREAADQYYNRGQYRKSEGVTEEMHAVLRKVVMPYAISVYSSNKRRVFLIDKLFEPNGLEARENEELERLQTNMSDFIHHVHPLPKPADLCLPDTSTGN